MDKTTEALTLEEAVLTPFQKYVINSFNDWLSNKPVHAENNHPPKLPLSFIKATIKTLNVYGFKLCNVSYQFLGLVNYHIAAFENEQMPESTALIAIDKEGALRFSFVPDDCNFFEAHHLNLSLHKAQDDIAAFASTLLDP